MTEGPATQTIEFSRRQSQRMVAGVAGGIADALGVSDAYVRAAFLTLGSVWGLGGFVYLAFWLFAYDRVEDREPRQVAGHQVLGLAIGFAGLMLLLGVIGWWPDPVVVLTATALAFGTASLADTSKPGPLAALIDPKSERPTRIRLLVGVGLLFGGLAVFATAIGPVFEFGAVFLAIILSGLGVVVAFGPWVRKLMADLNEERSERARQEERAEVAAHLHDSVLQTLALIQRTDDPGRMAILARHQESELRDWLFGTAPLDGIDLVSTALKAAAARVEEDHQIRVEVVTVGDHPVDDAGKALIGAASEAMVNAAKHSGADRVSLFFEADEEMMTVYISDQGKGFEVEAIPDDRKGLARSVRGRIEKVGGTVEIDTEPGEGTEVVLSMPLGVS